MSRELYAYIIADEPVLRSDLDEALEALGWSCRLFEDMNAFRPAEGAYIRSCDILAWDDANDLADQVDAAIAQRDQAALDRLYANNLIGTVAVDHEMPFTADPEMLEELRESGVEDSLVKRIAGSNQSYSARTSGGRNEFSLHLQTMVGTLLGIARYGILEDPQEGTFEDFAREVVENGDEPEDAVAETRRKPWWKFW